MKTHQNTDMLQKLFNKVDHVAFSAFKREKGKQLKPRGDFYFLSTVLLENLKNPCACLCSPKMGIGNKKKKKKKTENP